MTDVDLDSQTADAGLRRLLVEKSKTALAFERSDGKVSGAFGCSATPSGAFLVGERK